MVATSNEKENFPTIREMIERYLHFQAQAVHPLTGKRLSNSISGAGDANENDFTSERETSGSLGADINFRGGSLGGRDRGALIARGSVTTRRRRNLMIPGRPVV